MLYNNRLYSFAKYNITNNPPVIEINVRNVIKTICFALVTAGNNNFFVISIVMFVICIVRISLFSFFHVFACHASVAREIVMNVKHILKFFF